MSCILGEAANNKRRRLGSKAQRIKAKSRPKTERIKVSKAGSAKNVRRRRQELSLWVRVLKKVTKKDFTKKNMHIMIPKIQKRKKSEIHKKKKCSSSKYFLQTQNVDQP